MTFQKQPWGIVSVDYPTTKGPFTFLTPKIYLACRAQLGEVLDDAEFLSVPEPSGFDGDADIQALETWKQVIAREQLIDPPPEREGVLELSFVAAQYSDNLQMWEVWGGP